MTIINNFSLISREATARQFISTFSVFYNLTLRLDCLQIADSSQVVDYRIVAQIFQQQNAWTECKGALCTLYISRILLQLVTKFNRPAVMFSGCIGKQKKVGERSFSPAKTITKKTMICSRLTKPLTYSFFNEFVYFQSLMIYPLHRRNTKKLKNQNW